MGVTRVSGYTTRSGRRVKGYTQRRHGRRQILSLGRRTLTKRRLSGRSYGPNGSYRAGKPRTRSRGQGRVGNLSNGSVIRPVRRRNRTIGMVNGEVITSSRTKRKSSGVTAHLQSQAHGRTPKRGRPLFTGKGDKAPGSTLSKPLPRKGQKGHAALQRKLASAGSPSARKSIVNQGKPKAAPKGGNRMPTPVGSRDDFMANAVAKAKSGQLTPSRKVIDGSKERARRARKKK